MPRATVRQAMHYWALAAFTATARAYLSAKTWPDRGGRFNWAVSLILVISFLGALTWWTPYALGWLMGLGFCWVQVMGIDSDQENARLRKAVMQAGIPDECRAVFNRLDRWLLDGCLSPAGQQRLKAAGLAFTLPAAYTKDSRPRF